MKKYLTYVAYLLISILFICISNKSNANSETYYTYGINVGSTCYNLIEYLDEYENVTFYDKDDKVIEDLSEIVKTGMKMKLSKSERTDNIYCKIYVRGDVNGDGIRNEEDVLLIKQYMVKLIDLDDINKKAIDINSDDKISLYDLYYNIETVNNVGITEEIIDIDFELPNEMIKLDLGETIKIEPKYIDEKQDNNKENDKSTQNISILWDSSNTDVAKIDQEGNVTAVGNGTTLITAITEAGRIKSCEVTVTTSPKIIELDKEEIKLYINSDYSNKTINYELKPEGVNVNHQVTWTTSDSSIVSVDEQGRVEAKSNGNATVTITTENGITKSCNVAVMTLPTDIVIDKEEVSIEKGEIISLNSSVVPQTANYNTDIKYTTENEAIAAVDEKGIVKGISKGETIITASIYNDKKVQIRVSVYNTIKEINITPPNGKIDLTSNNEYTITATNEENIRINSEIQWKSSNEEIATVDKVGKLTALKNGEVTITATKGEISKEFKLIVETSPETVILSEKRGELQLGGQAQLSASFTPETVNINNQLTWRSSNPENVTVDGKGLLTAVRPGSSIITVTTANGKKDNCLVKVKGNTSGALFNEDDILLKNGDSKQVGINFNGETAVDNIKVTSSDNHIVSVQNTSLEEGRIIIDILGGTKGIATLTVNIDENIITTTVFVYDNLEDIELKIKEDNLDSSDCNYTVDLGNSSPILKVEALLNQIEINDKIQWSSDNEEVATIDEYGEIYCLQNGNVKIIAQIGNEWKKQINLVIQTSPTSISMKTKHDIYINSVNEENDKLIANVLPTKANVNQRIDYSSSDTSIVEVNSNGKLTAIRKGEADIIATTQNGKSATCRVYVKSVPEQIRLSESQLYLRKGISKKLTAYINPTGTNALNSLTYTSSDTRVARVDYNGNITACGQGEATITVTTGNGKTASCKVIVPNLRLSAQTTSLYINGVNSTRLIVSGDYIGNVNYSSSNANVAYIENGYVKARGNGTCTITAVESNSHTSTSLTFIVKTLASSVSLNRTNASLDISNTKVSIGATVYPSSVTIGGVNWSSSNTKVATVNSSGQVTRVGEGTATITATAKDGSGKNARCTVTVKKEKVILAGASTVAQMAGRRTIKKDGTAYAKIAYYRDYGYHIRTTDSSLKTYYSYLNYYGTNDTNSDLFFVFYSGAGLKWLSGNDLTANYWSNAGTSGEGIDKINKILNNNENCHFTIGIMLGGNDVKSSSINDKGIENVAEKYAKFYKTFNSNNSIYAITPTPTDNASSINRGKFAKKLKGQLSGSNVKVIDLYSKFLNNENFKTIDGSHYNKDTTKLVFRTILNNMGVLGSDGKKK